MGVVLTLFERIGATLPATLPEPVWAILVSGAAVHVYTRSPVLQDVEAIFIAPDYPAPGLASGLPQKF